MAVNRNFRTCPSSGLVFHEPAEKLMRWNAVVAVVFLLVGGLLAIGVTLTRWQAVHLLDPSLFYQVLTAHGLNMLVFWIIFFEIAVLYFASSTLLRCRLATPKMAWLGFWLMILGALMNNYSVIRGDSSVMFTSYAPMGAHPTFYLGLILFAVGALIACFVFFGTLVVARAERTYVGSVSLVTFGAITAAIIAVFTIASGAIILIPTLLWSLGLIEHIDSLMYRTIWWGFGHSSQQINVAAHVSLWYAGAAIVFGAKPMSEKVSRVAFLLYILFLQIASAHHLLADPGLTSNWKIFRQGAPEEVFRERVDQASQADKWVVAGNYSRVRPMIWSRAEAVIWLDYSLWRIFWQLTRRTFTRWWRHELLWGTNYEDLRTHFKLWSQESLYHWLFKTYWRRKREIPLLFAMPEFRHLKVMHFKHPEETRKWLNQLSISKIDKL